MMLLKKLFSMFKPKFNPKNIHEERVYEETKLFKEKRFNSLIKSTVLLSVVFFALCYVYVSQNSPEYRPSVQYTDYRSTTANMGYPEMLAYKEIRGGASNVFFIEYSGFVSPQHQVKMDRIFRDLYYNARKGDEVVLYINSPGGQATSCTHTLHTAKKLKRRGIKFTAFVDDIATSCAYKVAIIADSIYAEPGSVVGNIGSAMPIHTDPKIAALKKLGGQYFVVGSSRAKEVLAGDTIRSKDDLEIVREFVKESFELFRGQVMEARLGRLDLSKLDVIFSGKMFTAERGKRLGLVDGVVQYEDLLSRYLLSDKRLVLVEYK